MEIKRISRRAGKNKVRCTFRIIGEAAIPKELFFLNTLPRKDTQYLVLADGIIEANKVVMS